MYWRSQLIVGSASFMIHLFPTFPYSGYFLSPLGNFTVADHAVGDIDWGEKRLTKISAKILFEFFF